MKNIFLVISLLIPCVFFGQDKLSIVTTFNVTDGKKNGIDITETLIEQDSYLVLYKTGNSKELFLANIWKKDNSQSYGRIYNLKEEIEEETEKNYKSENINFKWSYINTYNSKQGTADVVLVKTYKPQAVIFKLTIISEDLDVLVYKGYIEGTLNIEKIQNKL